MCDGNKKLVGFYSGTQDAEAGDEPQRLGLKQKAARKCDFVVLSVLTTEIGDDDTIKPTIAAASISGVGDIQLVDGTEILWGFDNVCIHQLFPGQTTMMIPVEQLGDIFVRANANATAAIRVGYS